jgi:hypothetical protein
MSASIPVIPSGRNGGRLSRGDMDDGANERESFDQTLDRANDVQFICRGALCSWRSSLTVHRCCLGQVQMLEVGASKEDDC